MRIAFVHNQKAFLPEVAAYTRYFTQKGFQCEVVSPKELPRLQPRVAWHFMGMDMQPRRPGIFIIHEYTSASLPPFMSVKNNFKKMLNVQPDYRLFLNDYVRECFPFDDDVPFGYRDMGIEEEWLRNEPVAREYDFIYAGELRKGIEKLFDKIQDRSLLVVSNNYEQWKQRYPKIYFVGPLPHAEVHGLIRKARYGLNFMPQEEPFIFQTSTKFLEYCACKVPVVTSEYYWVLEFEQDYGGEYFYLEDDLSNLTWENIEQFNYQFPDLTEWTWEKQIERSGIVEVLEQLR